MAQPYHPAIKPTYHFILHYHHQPHQLTSSPISNTRSLSIGQLCDAGCIATFDKTTVAIDYNDNTVIVGYRSPITRLWHIDLPKQNPTVPLYINNAFRPHSTIADRIAYYHACCFSPALSTWCNAIDAGHFATWPGLSSALVRQHPPQSIAMYKGHLDQTRRNQRSTQTNSNSANNVAFSVTNPDNLDEPDTIKTPPPDFPTNIRSHHIFASCEPISGRISTDQTGRFIAPSSTGNVYLLIVYDYDSNMIFAEPMKTRSGPDHVKAFKAIHALLQSRGLKPQLQRLDNEASTLLKDFLHESNIDFQLVPPHAHRRNSAERAIRVFKNHFIAGLCSTDTDFPLHLWDRLLPQALITLNLLRSAHINPQLSAQELIFGTFNYNRTPMAPPGTKILIHVKPSVRASWSPHGIDGWYLGPAMEHYRCYRVYATETAAERIADTIAWFPEHVKMPTASSSEVITAAAADIIHALQHPSPASALSPLSDNQQATLRQLAELFQTNSAPLRPPPGFPPLPEDTTDTTTATTQIHPNDTNLQIHSNNNQLLQHQHYQHQYQQSPPPNQG